MNTKLEHILSTLKNEDLVTFMTLIPTKLFGGTSKHVKFLQKLIDNPKTATKSENIPLTQRLIMSELTKMVEKYIVITYSLESKYYRDKILLAHYRTTENEKLFYEYYQQIEKRAKPTLKNAAIYQYNSDIQYEKWEFDQLKNRFSNTEADDIIIHSEIAFISKKLMEAVSLAHQSALISKKINTSFIEYIEPYLLNQNYLQFPCISLYFYALKMVYEPNNIVWFENFSINLETNAPHFPTEELKTLYFQAINYCIRKHNSGDKTFSKKLLDYYITALDKKYLLTNGFLSKNTYRNINTIAIRMDRYDDAMQISKTNVQYLRKEDKESALKFNMANIYYAKQQYQEALEALREAEFDDHLSNLFAKTLMLKVYFEMKSMRLLDSHLDAMQVYLTRKKIIGYHKTNYSNIVKYTRKLIHLNPYDKMGKLKLAESIKKEKLLPDRDWLLKMVDA
jgi:tetratricopeptide (TPR) repeat protein